MTSVRPGSVNPQPRRRNMQQRSGLHGVAIVQRHFNCPECLACHWKRLPRNTAWADMECKGCGKYVEVKFHWSKSRPPKVRRTIPAGFFKKYVHHRRQGRGADLVIIARSACGDFTIVHISANDQPEGFVTPRVIKSGVRVGYEISDIHLSRGTQTVCGVFSPQSMPGGPAVNPMRHP